MEQMFDIIQALKGARDYVPHKEKAAFIAQCAGRCFDKLQITADGIVPLPDVYKENVAMKERYLLAALLRLYLGVPIEAASAEADPWLMSDAEYDKWAALHIESQIQRTKGDSELRNRCYDLLGDYWSLGRQFSAEISGMLAAMNDPITRIMASIKAGVTPERVQELAESVKKLESDLKGYDGRSASKGRNAND